MLETTKSLYDFAANLASGIYDNGIAVVLGKTLPGCPYPYSFALDFDGIESVMEFFGSWDNVLSLSKKTRIEWHQDRGSLHIVFFSNKHVAKKRIKFREKDRGKDKERVPGLEVRTDELLIVSPSIHADGNAWRALGVDMNSALSDQELLRLEAKINTLSQDAYISDENKQQYITWLEDPNRIIEEGGRHDANKILGCSYYYRYNNGWKDLTDDERYDRLQQWNQQHCIPPLPEKEFNDIWRWIVSRHRKQRDKQHQQLDDERRKSAETEVKLDDNIQQELEGSVFYITTNKPLKLTIAYKSSKMLIEASVKAYDNEVFGNDGNKLRQKIKILNQNKLYLTCIPVSKASQSIVISRGCN